jgi:hypothetical protein
MEQAIKVLGFCTNQAVSSALHRFLFVPGCGNSRGYRKNWGIEPGNVAKKDKNLTTEVYFLSVSS